MSGAPAPPPSPPILPDSLRRTHLARLRLIDTGAAAKAESHRTIVSRDLTLAAADAASQVRSNTRKHRASDAEISKYLWSRDAINEPQRATMEESVDIFLRAFRHENYRMPQFPRVLRGSDAPEALAPGAAEPPRSPRKLARVFDATGHYDLQQTPLTVRLPPLEITRRLKEFVGEDAPQDGSLLARLTIAPPSSRPPPAVSGGRRRTR
jgi:hypothetical protein